MALMQRATNSNDPNSIGNRMRGRRFRLFTSLIADLPRPLTILDVGGTAAFWKNRGLAGDDGLQITVLNLAEEPRVADNLHPVVGDATDMNEFGDQTFDVAFSNSVIEHLFTIDAQRKMADEVRRVAKAHWVQTPNYWFPMEPHFHMIGWQWLPEPVRVAMIRRRRCGWRGPCPDRDQARAAVREVRLMRGVELRRLFPESDVWGERMFGMVKSWVAHAGFPKAIVDVERGERAGEAA